MKKIIYCIVTICFCQVAFSQTLDLKDSRDGKVYKVVKIGNQKWMAENLAFNCGSGCWAYDNDQNNIVKYGYLYNWKAAKNVCPAGWHLPSKVEFETLLNNTGGKGTQAYNKAYNLLIQGGSSGFSAPFGGWRGTDGGFYGIDGSAGFWSSSPSDVEGTWDLDISSDDKWALMGNDNRSCGYSVRCIQNK